jgi:hypothetical protein
MMDKEMNEWESVRDRKIFFLPMVAPLFGELKMEMKKSNRD